MRHLSIMCARGAHRSAERSGSAEREPSQMDQLINQITQRTGISPTQAQQAVQMVVGFLKDKLPGPVASQLDGVMSGQGMGGMPGQAQQQQGMGGLGGMFGQQGQPPSQ